MRLGAIGQRRNLALVPNVARVDAQFSDAIFHRGQQMVKVDVSG